MWCWRRMEKIKWPKKVTNEQVLDHIGKETLLNNILRREANWIGHILRRNCLLHDAIEGQMTEVKGVGRRITQLLDDLRNRRRYWELKEESEDPKKMEKTVYQSNISIFHKSLDLLISSILNNNNINFSKHSLVEAGIGQEPFTEDDSADEDGEQTCYSMFSFISYLQHRAATSVFHSVLSVAIFRASYQVLSTRPNSLFIDLLHVFLGLLIFFCGAIGFP